MDDIEMARPKGLLILFTSFKLLDILDDAAFRHVVNAMRDYFCYTILAPLIRWADWRRK